MSNSHPNNPIARTLQLTSDLSDSVGIALAALDMMVDLVENGSKTTRPVGPLMRGMLDRGDLHDALALGVQRAKEAQRKARELVGDITFKSPVIAAGAFDWNVEGYADAVHSYAMGRFHYTFLGTIPGALELAAFADKVMQELAVMGVPVPEALKIVRNDGAARGVEWTINISMTDQFAAYRVAREKLLS